MSAIERLARLTAHGTTGLGGRASRDTLTAQDIAAAVAMANLGPGPQLLALALGTLERPHLQAWRSYWLRAVRAHAAPWGAPAHRVTRLGLITHVDMIQPARCAHCNGAGLHKNQKTCAACGGVGRIERTDADEAAKLEIDPAEWRSTWSARYHRLMAVTSMWQGEADKWIGRALR